MQIFMQTCITNRFSSPFIAHFQSHNGINGYICKQKDSAHLIKQVEKFLALSWEEQKAMGIAGRRKVEKEFDRQIVIDKYLQEVAQVAKR